MLPKITIITPSFNQGQYIEQTITSILDQGYPNLEYIIMDGGSNDQTVDVIKKYEDKITHWVSEPDNGQAHAINKGLALATGDIINWINSDDYLEPGALHALAKAWQNNPSGEVFCGYTHCFWHETGDTSHTYRMGLQKSATSTLLNIEMNQPGTFYKTAILKSLGPVNESLRYVFDNELWMRYLCSYGQKRVVLLKDLLAHFRQHDQSKSIGDGFAVFGQEQNAVLNHLASTTQLPDYLYQCMVKEVAVDYYLPEKWNLSHFNTKKFHGYFANKYMVTLYNANRKSEAKDCISLAMQAGAFKMNRKNLGLLKNNLLKK